MNRKIEAALRRVRTVARRKVRRAARNANQDFGKNAS